MILFCIIYVLPSSKSYYIYLSEKFTKFENIETGQKVRFLLSSTLAPLGHDAHMGHGSMNQNHGNSNEN